MRKIIIGLFTLGVVLIGAGYGGARPPTTLRLRQHRVKPLQPPPGRHRQRQRPPGAEAAAPAAAGDVSPHRSLVKSTPVGQGLKNPYADKIAEVAEEGHKRFLGAGCNGCHGGTGGGGMCPPISNEAWNYDPTDDTLFRLVTLGSNCKDYPDCMEKEGFLRHARETVSFPMPSQGQPTNGEPEKAPPLTKADDLWKIISWIRVINPNSLKFKAAPPPPQ